MTTTDNIPGIPAGPVDTEPRGFYLHAEQAAIVRDVLAAAGVEIGAYDTRIIDWLAGWDYSTFVTVASWVARAAQREPAPTVALPDRFDASPAEVDQHLRRILAEDVYLRYQQAIGGAAVTEAVQDVREQANQADVPGSPASSARLLGWTEAADYMDPTKDGGPYPSQLQCSRHDGGFGPRPGAPNCTPDDTVKGEAQ